METPFFFVHQAKFDEKEKKRKEKGGQNDIDKEKKRKECIAKKINQ